MAKAKAANVVTRKVRLEGIRPIMFDKYSGKNDVALPVEQKLYFAEDGKTIVLPAANISSFLCALNTDSACKRVYKSTAYRKKAQAVLSFTSIDPMLIPFARDGKPIRFSGLKDDRDEAARVYVDRRVARLKLGIPNPKERPVLELPWALEFGLTFYPNEEIDEREIRTLFERCGIAIGLGTFRGVYGKFVVAAWD